MNLVDRVKGIIVSPKTEWPIIAGEQGDVGYLFSNYVAILAAIPAVCGFIGSVLIGASIVGALLQAVVGYVLTFVVVYVIAWIVNLLAPTFASHKDFPNALKVTVYSSTPGWLAGIFLLIPSLSFLEIVAALYGIYLAWLGLPPVMKTPHEKAIWYTITIIVCWIVLWFLIVAVLAVIGLRAFR
jgi:Yip1 domain